MALVRGTITCIKPDRNGKMFGFVCLGNGTSVFVPPQLFASLEAKGSRRGTIVYLTYSKSGKGAKATHVQLDNKVYTASKTRGVAWGAWQTGAQQIMLPDTVPGSCHDGISLGCAKCGATIASSGDIYKSKGRAMWSCSDLSQTVNERGDFTENPFKRCNIWTVVCRQCGNDVGSLYKEPYHDDDAGSPAVGPFPRIKITIAHGKRFRNQTCLLGTEADVRNATSQLEQSGGASLRVSRVIGSNFDEMRSAEEALSKLENAEDEKRRLEELVSQLQSSSILAAASLKHSDDDDDDGKEGKEGKDDDDVNAIQAAYEQERSLREKAEGELIDQQATMKQMIEDGEAAHTRTTISWICKVDEGDIQYDKDIATLLESCYTSHKAASFSVGAHNYEVDWANMHQMNTKTGVRREIVRVEMKCSVDVEEGMYPWSSPVRDIAPGVRQYQIKKEDLTTENTNDLHQFQFAAGHFSRLTGKGVDKVNRIDSWYNDTVKSSYEEERERLGASKEVFVFHGTNPANIDPIMTTGLKVGGQGEVGVANGDTFGRGVYTADGPGT